MRGGLQGYYAIQYLNLVMQNKPNYYGTECAPKLTQFCHPDEQLQDGNYNQAHRYPLNQRSIKI